MQPAEMLRELQSWERLVANPDYQLTIQTHIAQQCAAHKDRVMNCSDAKILAVRDTYREMNALKDYPEARIAALREAITAAAEAAAE